MSATLPLAGLGIVITRPREPAEALARALERDGARTFVFPALAIEDLPPSPALEAALAALPGSRLKDCWSKRAATQRTLQEY